MTGLGTLLCFSKVRSAEMYSEVQIASHIVAHVFWLRLKKLSNFWSTIFESDFQIFLYNLTQPDFLLLSGIAGKKRDFFI